MGYVNNMEPMNEMAPHHWNRKRAKWIIGGIMVVVLIVAVVLIVLFVRSKSNNPTFLLVPSGNDVPSSYNSNWQFLSQAGVPSPATWAGLSNYVKARMPNAKYVGIMTVNGSPPGVGNYYISAGTDLNFQKYSPNNNFWGKLSFSEYKSFINGTPNQITLNDGRNIYVGCKQDSLSPCVKAQNNLNTWAIYSL
jgi:hypothetical protein